MVILVGPLVPPPSKKGLVMAIITTYPTKEEPAPRFEGEKIVTELRRLLDEDHSPELCFVTGDKLCSSRRRLVKSKCRIHNDGTIYVVARILGACFCPHSEEKFYFSPATGDEFMPMEGKRIMALVVGYPRWDVSTVIENTHLGTKVTFDSHGRRMAG